METIIVVVAMCLAGCFLISILAGKAGLFREKPDCGCGSCASRKKGSHR